MINLRLYLARVADLLLLPILLASYALAAVYHSPKHLGGANVNVRLPKQQPPQAVKERFSLRLAFRPVLSLGFLLASGVVLANASAGYWNLRTVAAMHHWVAHTHEVMNAIKATLSLLTDAETGQRGYLITGDQRYLQPYDAAVKEINGRLESLCQSTEDNPSQKARTDALRHLIDDRLAELEETIRLRRAEGFEAAKRVVLADRGKEKMDEIRGLMGEMDAAEQALLERRAEDFDLRLARSLGMVVVVACIVVISFIVRRLLAPTRGTGPEALPSTNNQGSCRLLEFRG